MNHLARRYALAFLLCLGLAHPSRAQQPDAQPVKYWIFLQDKLDAAGKTATPEPGYLSARARERRRLRGTTHSHTLDAPLSPTYLERLQRLGVAPQVQSRWLNAVSAFLDDQQAAAVGKLPFVRAVYPVGRTVHTPVPEAAPPAPAASAAGKATTLDYGASRTQLEAINAIPALERGINGQGVRLGFLDSEFDGFQHPAFARLVQEGRLIAVQQFTSQSQRDFHGRSVASVAVGFAEGNLIGPAYGTEVLAAITEQSRDASGQPVEWNEEEDNFVAGLEWLEARGVDVVNTSLGYSTFDAGQRSYTRADLDGNTGVTTRAADRAVALGVVVVASAGNEGCNGGPTNCPSKWYYITMPADGDSVIAVGAVSGSSALPPLADFSSRGPTADGRIKPDVVAMGVDVYHASSAGENPTFTSGRGTSFASPLVAGVVCQMLQVNPRLTPIQVRDILRNSASKAATPDNDFGWGVIDAEAAILAAEEIFTATEDSGAPPDAFLLSQPYPNPFSDETVFDVRAPTGAGFARMTVYNLLGQRVGVPFEGALQAGVNRIVFRPEGLPPGLYLYALQGDRVSISGKMVLAR